MRELSDDEVFGSTKELSDADVFGPAKSGGGIMDAVLGLFGGGKTPSPGFQLPPVQDPMGVNRPAKAAPAFESVLNDAQPDPSKFNFKEASIIRRMLDDTQERNSQYGTIGPIVGPQVSAGSVAKGLLTDVVAGGKGARAGVNQMVGDLIDSERLQKQALKERGQADLMSAVNTPEIESATGRGIYGGLSSIVRNAPSLALAYATRNPAVALGGMAAPMLPEEYGKFRQRGGTPLESLAGAAGTTATEVATEMLPMGFLVKQFGKAGAGQFLSGLLAREVPGEQVATLVQDAIDTAVANPDKTWGEYIKERPGAAYQTLIATLTQGGIMGAGNAAVNRLSQPAPQATPEDVISRVLGQPAAPSAPAPVMDQNAVADRIIAAINGAAPTQELSDAEVFGDAPAVPTGMPAPDVTLTNEGKTDTPAAKPDRQAVQAQANTLAIGDVLVNDMGDEFPVSEVLRNKQGDVTAVVFSYDNGKKFDTLDFAGIASILTPQPYTVASTGERKMSEPGSIRKAKPSAALTTQPAQPGETPGQGAGVSQPTQAAPRRFDVSTPPVGDLANDQAVRMKAASLLGIDADATPPETFGKADVLAAQQRLTAAQNMVQKNQKNWQKIKRHVSPYLVGRGLNQAIMPSAPRYAREQWMAHQYAKNVAQAALELAEQQMFGIQSAKVNAQAFGRQKKPFASQVQISPAKTSAEADEAQGYTSDETSAVDGNNAKLAEPAGLEYSPKSPIAMSMPTFKGNKRTMLGMAVSAIRNGMNAQAINQIDDWFGGGGMWSTALANATLPNVKTIRIAELNPLRIKRIQWMHERGNKLLEDMQNTGALAVYRSLVADFAKQGIVSPSPFGDIAVELAGFGSGENIAWQRAQQSGATSLSEDGKVLLAALGDLAFGNRGSKIQTMTHLKAMDGQAVDKFLAKAAFEMDRAYQAAQEFRSRGGRYTYFPAGSSYDLVPENAAQGQQVLSLADPPYYNTTGYKGAGDFSTGDKWNAAGYAATRDLLKTLADRRNHILYTDEAWWRRSDQLPDNVQAGRILGEINGTLSNLIVAPEKVGNRYEQLGIHNPGAAVRGAAGTTSRQSQSGGRDGNQPDAGGRSDGGLAGGEVSGEPVVQQGDRRGLSDPPGPVAERARGQGGSFAGAAPAVAAKLKGRDGDLPVAAKQFVDLVATAADNVKTGLNKRLAGNGKDYELRVIPLDSVKLQQFGEDYLNDSSRYTAEQIRLGRAAYNRPEDIYPILVSEDGLVLDGHHRHAAATINNESGILALVPVKDGTGRILNFEEFVSGKPTNTGNLKDLPRRQQGNPLDRLPETAKANVIKRLDALATRLGDGAITDEQFAQGAQAVIEQVAQRKVNRGPDWVQERLIRAKRKGELEADTVDLALWALSKNPAMATDLAIMVSDTKEPAAGDYNPVTETMRIFKSTASETTAVHEILHHTERMMPPEVQAGILREYNKAWGNAYNKGDAKVKGLLRDMLMAAAGDKKAMDRVVQGFEDGTLDYDTHYALFNPSEFWAVKASDIMAKRYVVQGSWVAQAKQWLRELIQLMKGKLGLSSDAPIIKALEAVLKGDGTKFSKDVLANNESLGDMQRPETLRDIPKNQKQSPNRDALGRVKFRLGEVALGKLDAATRPLQERFGMRMASPELRRQLRSMKATIDQANRSAANVAQQMKDMPEADRAMVSDIVEKMIAPGVVPPEHAVRVADAITKTMDRQTDELVALGMLSQDSADRWRGRYLPRIYNRKTELGENTTMDMVKNLFKTGRPTMQGIGGGSLKGRGLFQDVSVDSVDQWLAMGYEVRDPHWKLNQGKLELVDKNAPQAAKDQVTVWRDWTPSERAQMGENRDALFRYVQGYTSMQRDIALGRLFNQIANNPDWVRRSASEGWVKVPDTEIPDTGGVKRYGNLAGLYVKPDVMSHLSRFEESANEALQLWRDALGLWKEGKTALNPVAHFNNIASNISMAHFAGVSYWDGHKYVNAARDLVNDAPMVEEAREAGLFTGSFTKEELMQNMPPELQKMMQMEDSKLQKLGSKAMNALTFWLRKPLRDAYEFEDAYFKYLIYRDARKQGMSPEAATDYALKYIFTYDDLPSGARKVRDFAIPFFSWSYKAMPALLHTAMVYPWRFIAPAAMLHGINTIAYALAAGDEGDDWLKKLAKGRELEKEEREALPERSRGTGMLLNPKTIRLGTDSLTGNPVFLDASRVVPGGDMFDMENQAGGLPIPAPLMPNHPVLSAFSAMIANKELFMGREVVDKNDTGLEAAEKRAKWMAGFMLPAVAPGGYHSQRILDATANAMDTVIKTPLGEFTGVDKSGLPVQPKYAAMQTLGIKARPVDLELEASRRKAQESALVNSIAAEVRSMSKLYQKGAVSDDMMERTRETAREKIERMREKE